MRIGTTAGGDERASTPVCCILSRRALRAIGTRQPRHIQHTPRRIGETSYQPGFFAGRRGENTNTVRVFVYEWVTGGGWFESQGSAAPPPSLVCEGTAMLAALAADLAACDGVEMHTMRDARLHNLAPLAGQRHVAATPAAARHVFGQQVQAADWTLVIAPELDGRLLACCEEVERRGGRLLGPAPSLVALTSDKHATCEHLAERGVPVPPGWLWSAEEASRLDTLPDSDGPWVVKRCDGAGSLEMQLAHTTAEMKVLARRLGGRVRVERWCPGQPVSVAALCGPADQVLLEPCRQHLSDDGRFQYLGGSLPLSKTLRSRAVELAARAISTLSAPRGYLGVDLVLGADEAGRDDVVVEINPRPTTSYVGLRAASQTNLAAALLAIVAGKSVDLCFDPTPLEFTAAGEIMQPANNR